MATNPPVPERIGLLFVHGIGEQKRFEHLRNSAREYAELLQQSHEDAVVTVTDRTDVSPLPAGTAPLTIRFRSKETGARQIHFECEEVWWADLGTRSGVVDVLLFWFWGLGQWGAPMYREIDASRLPKDATAPRRDDASQRKPVSSLTRLPKQLAGLVVPEFWTRFRLSLAGLAAALVAASWLLAKKAFQAILGQAPSPVILVQYVGDVRTYESPWVPGDANLEDPGRPRRVAIRRRMVSAMVEMGARAHAGELDGWYVCAHSLGTILAYNGLTEISHALPNYLTKEQWAALPPALREDPACAKRDASDLHNMMPSRPDWLGPEDVINRPVLFGKLRGILTYGSPLDKFAALWPRIVATATDQPAGQNPFPKNCDWLNFSKPEDPVAGTIDAYNSHGVVDTLDDTTPEVVNIVMPVGFRFGIAHIEYFSGTASATGSAAQRQKRAIMRWLTQEATAPLEGALTPTDGELLKRQPEAKVVLTLFGGYFIILMLLALATGVLWWMVFHAGDSLLSGKSMRWPSCAEVIAATTFSLGAAFSVVTVSGVLRWLRESASSRNQAVKSHIEAKAALSAAGADADAAEKARLQETLWRWTARMYGAQTGAAWVVLLLLVLPAVLLLNPWAGDIIACLPGLARFCHCLDAVTRCFGGGVWPLVMLALLGFASLAQAALNTIVPTTTNVPQQGAPPQPLK